MEIPIVLIHKKDHPCLEFSLRAARQHHDNVFLISDIKNNKYNKYCDVIDINVLDNEKSIQFSKLYQHLSSNSCEFEFICINRWFLLLEFMKSNHLDKVIYIDSDILVYQNLPKIIEQYYRFDICLCTPQQVYEDFNWVSSGHTLFCTYDALEKLCDFILKIYSNNFDELQKKWKWHQENKKPGGINDMTLLYLFQRNTDLRVGNFLEVWNDAFCFDSQIGSDSNFKENEYEMENSFLLNKKIKKIIFNDKHPFVFNKLTKKNIQFITLHFQSDAKNIISLYIKDKKTQKTFWSDFYLTSKIFYYAIRRELSKKIRS